MKKNLLIGIAAIAVILLGLPFRAGQPQNPVAQPQFTSDGKLVRPEGYRRWVFVSSGFGMSYTQSPSGMQDFTNVFVTPAAYDYFTANGKWPDKTMLCWRFMARRRAARSISMAATRRILWAWTWK